MFDGKAFGLEVVEAVKAHVTRTVTPLIARIDGLEASLLKANAELARIQEMAKEPGPKGDPGRDGIDGKDADMKLLEETVRRSVEEAVEKSKASSEISDAEFALRASICVGKTINIT